MKLKAVLNKQRLPWVMLALALLGTTPVANAADADSFEDAMRGINTSGQFRFGYIHQDPDVAGSPTTSAGAIGGQIKLETRQWRGVRLGLAPYFSEKIAALSGDEAAGELNGDFFDDNGDSYAYLGEAYLDYSWSNGSLRWGRQQLDTPFINTDAIRILPHTYEAAWFWYQPLSNLSLQGGRATKWAGFASGGDPGKFKDVGGDGAIALGATYKMKAHHTFQGWYYDFDNAFSLLYADAIYNNGHLEGGVQYADFNEKNGSGTDGSAWGLKLGYDFDVVKLGAAYNKTSNDPGKSASVGLCGCGSFFTSLDEINIAGKTDAKAWLLSLEYPVNQALVLAILRGHFEDANKATTDIDETNFVLTYALNEMIDAEYIYADVQNSAVPTDVDSNFSRHLLRVNYNF
ncbi:MAG: porin [Thioalkalispiraceae bacterium]|jgi:hypothetical protein